ncbi:hypothetical protein HDU97_005505 [Phlyctochytrium planicorne]|nr:hypothetical protein HDU97_005505 [Phlyctochytrium planicorne]
MSLSSRRYVAILLFVISLTLSCVLGAPARAEKTIDTSSVKRNNAVKLPVTGFADFISGKVKFSSIDVLASKENQLAFALENFPIPDDPSETSPAQEQKITDSLLVYLANEGQVRASTDPKIKLTLGTIKGVKFFLQFQKARIDLALHGGSQFDVDHQRQKTIKNAGRAKQSDIAQLSTMF